MKTVLFVGVEVASGKPTARASEYPELPLTLFKPESHGGPWLMRIRQALARLDVNDRHRWLLTPTSFSVVFPKSQPVFWQEFRMPVYSANLSMSVHPRAAPEAADHASTAATPALQLDWQNIDSDEISPELSGECPPTPTATRVVNAVWSSSAGLFRSLAQQMGGPLLGQAPAPKTPVTASRELSPLPTASERIDFLKMHLLQGKYIPAMEAALNWVQKDERLDLMAYCLVTTLAGCLMDVDPWQQDNRALDSLRRKFSLVLHPDQLNAHLGRVSDLDEANLQLFRENAAGYLRMFTTVVDLLKNANIKDAALPWRAMPTSIIEAELARQEAAFRHDHSRRQMLRRAVEPALLGAASGALSTGAWACDVLHGAGSSVYQAGQFSLAATVGIYRADANQRQMAGQLLRQAAASMASSITGHHPE